MFQANDPVTNGITDGVEVRKQRGLEIAAMARIEKQGDFYVVPSQTSPRPTKYKVKFDDKTKSCSCLDHETHGCFCKHLWAVSFAVRREENKDGSTTVTESITVTKTKKTYPQQWPQYNAAQMNEKREFQILLADLCKGLSEAMPDPLAANGRGRPRFPLADAVFTITYKVYSTFSGRRFTSDLCDAQERGHIDRVPHYNTAFKFIENPELFPILVGLIEKSLGLFS